MCLCSLKPHAIEVESYVTLQKTTASEWMGLRNRRQVAIDHKWYSWWLSCKRSD